MIKIARKKILSKKAIFIIADLNDKWNIKNNTYDLATLNLVLEHIKNLDHIFSSLFMKLKRGGKCFICEIHPKKQLSGSRARYIKNNVENILDIFQHSEQDYIKSANNTGFN